MNVVKIMPETAIKFGSYEAAKRAFANMEGHGDPQLINSFSKFTAGGVAGMIAQYVGFFNNETWRRLTNQILRLSSGYPQVSTAMLHGGRRPERRGADETDCHQNVC